MASPHPPPFVPKFITTLLTILVLGVMWHIIYDQLAQKPPHEPTPSDSTAHLATLAPTDAVPPPVAPTPPAAPQSLSAPQEHVPVRTLEPPPMALTEEAHEHRGLSLNCKMELKQLCSDVQPGGGRLKRCYREREPQLSLPCQQQVEEQAALKRVAYQRVVVLCAEDARTFCNATQTGKGRLHQCLEEHYQDVSRPCYEALDRLTTN